MAAASILGIFRSNNAGTRVFPIPRLAPVTKATLSCILMCSPIEGQETTTPFGLPLSKTHPPFRLFPAYRLAKESMAMPTLHCRMTFRRSAQERWPLRE